MTIRNYSDLIAWRKAMSLAVEIYRASRDMPAEERYGLTSQMRRAATSIPAKIAEGQGRRTDGEFLNQLSVAHGSVRELETLILLTKELGFIPNRASETLMRDCGEVGRLVTGLANSIRH